MPWEDGDIINQLHLTPTKIPSSPPIPLEGMLNESMVCTNYTFVIWCKETYIGQCGTGVRHFSQTMPHSIEPIYSLMLRAIPLMWGRGTGKFFGHPLFHTCRPPFHSLFPRQATTPLPQGIYLCPPSRYVLNGIV